MSTLEKVKKAIRSTPVVGGIYLRVAETYHYPNWRRLCRKGRKYMSASAGTKFDYAKPLKLDVLKSIEVQPKLNKNFFQYNPTICLEENGLRVYWRISNWRDCPDVDFLGSRKVQSGLYGEKLITRTASGFLPVTKGSISGDLQDEEIIAELDPEISNSDEEQRVESDTSIAYITYEDPKVLVSDPSLLALTAFEITLRGDERIRRNYMVLFDLKSKRIIRLLFPGQKSMEKNWVLARSTSELVTLLRQSEPHQIVEVDRRTGALIKENIQPAKVKAFLNGGSSFVLVDDSYYLRVARHRISLPRFRSIHVSHIVKHDLDFNEISRTKPFIFRKYAFEICNGLDFDGDHFFFSWGENDEKIFVGSVEKHALLDWLDVNQASHL